MEPHHPAVNLKAKMEFQNEKRERYYGKRIGDRISAKTITGKVFGEGVVTGYGWDNNQINVQFDDGTETKWVAEWCDIIQKIEDLKQVRPDLSFLTSTRLNNVKEYTDFCKTLKKDQYKTLERAVFNIPKLIAIAEMYYDSVSNKSAISCIMTLQTLNDIKGTNNEL